MTKLYFILSIIPLIKKKVGVFFLERIEPKLLEGKVEPHARLIRPLTSAEVEKTAR